MRRSISNPQLLIAGSIGVLWLWMSTGGIVGLAMFVLFVAVVLADTIRIIIEEERSASIARNDEILDALARVSSDISTLELELKTLTRGKPGYS